MDKLIPAEQKLIIDKANAWARSNKKQLAKHYIDKNKYPEDKDPVAFFMAGCPAAGKTEVAKALAKNIAKELQRGEPILHLDPDSLREQVKGYDGSISELFQEATTIIVNACFDRIMKNKPSFILDGTLSNFEIAKKNIERCLDKKRKYDITLCFVYNDPIRAWETAKLRKLTTGRDVKLDVFIDRYFKSRDNANALKKEFGSKITLDILFKDLNSVELRPEFNVSSIDSHIPCHYTRESLKLAIQKLEAKNEVT